MSEDIFNKVGDLHKEVVDFQIDTPTALEEFRLKFLGTKSVLKDIFGELKYIPNDRKKDFGLAVNALKQAAEEKFALQKESLESSAYENIKVNFDMTAPSIPVPQGSRHPISITLNKIVSIFERIGFTIAEEREIEDDWHNFTAMNTPDDHPARDMQDTFYLKDSVTRLLRTHTSSVQSRVMTSTKPPIRIIAPGRVYRNETISSRSHCQFHQVEGLYINEKVSFADMKQTLLYFAREMYGAEKEIRLRPSYFPFTEPSAEMDVYWGLKDEVDHRITKGTGWLEILGCGMVDPEVLTNCGIDADRYSGFAFCMGVERQAMLLYRVDDIRLYFENDVRFLKQFTSAS